MRILCSLSLAVALLVAADAVQAQSGPGSGPYAGIVGGYGWGSSSQRDTFIAPPPNVVVIDDVPKDGDYRVRGGLFGVTAGFGVVANKVLLGIEGDVSWSGIEGSSSTCGGDHRCGTQLDGVATLRARAGLPFGSTLAYVTGGLAVGRIHAYDRLDPSFEGSKTKTGWTIGGGLEQKLDPRWALKLEYLFMDFGRDTYFTIPGFTPERVDLEVHTVRLGLTYSFDNPAPAYASLK